MRIAKVNFSINPRFQFLKLLIELLVLRTDLREYLVMLNDLGHVFQVAWCGISVVRHGNVHRERSF